MKNRSILYIGSTDDAAGLRIAAMQRIGLQVTVLNPYHLFKGSRVLRSWLFKTGGFGAVRYVRRRILALIGNREFDYCFILNGEFIDQVSVRELKRRCGKVINYNQDNPFSVRDGNRWRVFHGALREYDLFVTPRESNVDPAYSQGARRVLRTWFAADEELHRPLELTKSEMQVFESEVSFVGTWMPERGAFLARLIEHGVPLKIFGPRWHKAPEYEVLRPYVMNRSVQGREYVCAISGSKIALALLSKGNHDFHTTRSLEIPSIGTLLCGERTHEHLALYQDGREAYFWNNADECAEICKELLKDPNKIKVTALAGHLRAISNGHYNEPNLREILSTLQ